MKKKVNYNIIFHFENMFLSLILGRFLEQKKKPWKKGIVALNYFGIEDMNPWILRPISHINNFKVFVIFGIPGWTFVLNLKL